LVGKVRLAFLGCGWMGQRVHLPNFLKLDDCEIVALCELREKLGKAVAGKHGIPRYYRSHEDLMPLEDIDAVVSITNDDLHAPIAIDLLRSGKHCYTEKPMATNVEDARSMVNASEKAGRKLMIAYMKRYDPGCIRAKEVIDALRVSQELGRITFVRVHDFGGEWVCNLDEPMVTTDETYPKADRRPPKWLPEDQVQRFYGFNNVFCHDINLLRWFLGDPVEVRYSIFHDGYHNSIIGYEDFNVSFETGHISSRFWDEEVKVYFQHGWVDVKVPPPLLRNVPADVYVYKAGSVQRMEVPYASWTWSFKNEAEHFIQCILKDQEPLTSGHDSFKDTVVVEAIYRSFLEGTSVKLFF